MAAKKDQAVQELAIANDREGDLIDTKEALTWDLEAAQTQVECLTAEKEKTKEELRMSENRLNELATDHNSSVSATLALVRTLKTWTNHCTNPISRANYSYDAQRPNRFVADLKNYIDCISKAIERIELQYTKPGVWLVFLLSKDLKHLVLKVRQLTYWHYPICHCRRNAIQNHIDDTTTIKLLLGHIFQLLKTEEDVVQTYLTHTCVLIEYLETMTEALDDLQESPKHVNHWHVDFEALMKNLSNYGQLGSLDTVDGPQAWIESWTLHEESD